MTREKEEKEEKKGKKETNANLVRAASVVMSPQAMTPACFNNTPVSYAGVTVPLALYREKKENIEGGQRGGGGEEAMKERGVMGVNRRRDDDGKSWSGAEGGKEERDEDG